MKSEHRVHFAAHAPPAPHWFRPQMAEPRPAEVLPPHPVLRQEYLDGGVTGENRYPSPLLSQWLLERSDEIETSCRARHEWDLEHERQTLAQWPWVYADLVLGARVGRTRSIVELVNEAARLSLTPLFADAAATPATPGHAIGFRSPRCDGQHAIFVDAADEEELAEVVDTLRDAVVDSIVEALAIAGLVQPDAARRTADLLRQQRAKATEEGRALDRQLDDDFAPDNFPDPTFAPSSGA